MHVFEVADRIGSISKENLHLVTALGNTIALLNALQTLENFREIERLTKNSERLNQLF